MGFGHIQGFQRHPDQQMNVTMAAMQEVGKETAQEVSSEQKAAMASAQAGNAQMVTRPKTEKPKKTLKARSSKVNKMMKAKGEKKLLPVKQLERKAEEHSQKNPELKASVLEALRKRLRPNADLDEVQDLVGQFYRDPLLANDAMEFLLDTTEGELHKQVQIAHDDHVNRRGREIVAGRSIAKEVQKAFDQGLGEKVDLRKEYWDMVSQPRDFQQLFSELFGEAQKAKRKFFFHAVGDHMKDPNLTSLDQKPLMSVLMNFKSNLQAVGTTEKVMKDLMRIAEKEAGRPERQISLPKTLTSEKMATSFVSYIGERYASPQKLDGIAKQLGIDGNVPAMILIFTQFQRAIGYGTVGQLPPRIYQSDQHRKELGETVTTKLDELEDKVIEMREAEMERGGADYLDVEIEREGKKEQQIRGTEGVEKAA